MLIVFLLMSAWQSPPLLSFSAYFCLLYVRRRLHELYRYFRSVDIDPSVVVRSIVIVTVVSVVLAVLAGFLLRDIATTDISGSVLRLVFFALSALTLPHMLIVGRWQYASLIQASERISGSINATKHISRGGSAESAGPRS